MDFAPIYLLQRFFYRIGSFFKHWYIDGSRSVGHSFISALASADQQFALAITVRHFFEPLYKDYSAIGRILGIIFRSVRIVFGVIAYLIVSAIFLFLYVIWIAIPPIIILYVFKTI